VRFPHATEHRRGWREALEATRDEWQAAYENRQSPFTRAFEHLQSAGMTDWTREAFHRHRERPTVLALAPPPVKDGAALLEGDHERLETAA
jgi:hypothetical protein